MTSRRSPAPPGYPGPPLYRSYPHLKEEFERRIAEARAAGKVTDPRDAQITRLKDEIQGLRQRLASRAGIAELTEFKIQALSCLAAQHHELQQLRADTAQLRNVHPLPNR